MHFFRLHYRRRYIAKPIWQWLLLQIQSSSSEPIRMKLSMEYIVMKTVKYRYHRLLVLWIEVKKHVKWSKLRFILVNKVVVAISFIQNIQRDQSLCKLLHVQILQWRNTWTGTVSEPLVRDYMKFYLCGEIYKDSILDQAFTYGKNWIRGWTGWTSNRGSIGWPRQFNHLEKE